MALPASSPETSSRPTGTGSSSNPRHLLEAALRDELVGRNGLAGLDLDEDGWRALATAAHDQKLLGLLFARFIDAPGIPPEVATAVRRTHAIGQLRQAQLVVTQELVFGALTAAGTAWCALKGPVLSERLYGDPLARRSVDVDVLISPDELERATRAVEAIGFRRDGGPYADLYLTDHQHVTLWNGRSTGVEVHYRPAHAFEARLEARDLLGRTVPYTTMSGVRANILSPEDELLYLAVHAAGHFCWRLLWLYDLATMVRTKDALDWSAIRRRAERANVKRALAFVAESLDRRLGVTIPIESPRLGRVRRKTAFALSTFEARGASRRVQTGAGIAYEVTLCDSPAQAGRLLRKRLWFSARVSRRRALARRARAEG